jgi:hypothetical protein
MRRRVVDERLAQRHDRHERHTQRRDAEVADPGSAAVP